MIVSLNNLTTSFQFFADIHFVLHFVMFMQMLNSAVFHLLVAAIVFDSIGHIAMCLCQIGSCNVCFQHFDP